MLEYEWTIQEQEVYIDEDGVECYDILNHDFSDRLDQYGPYQWEEINGKDFALTLIRRDWKSDYSNWSGEEAEAYLNDSGMWVLPDKFSNINGNETVKVPQKFHKELARRQKKLDKRA